MAILEASRPGPEEDPPFVPSEEDEAFHDTWLVSRFSGWGSGWGQGQWMGGSGWGCSGWGHSSISLTTGQDGGCFRCGIAWSIADRVTVPGSMIPSDPSVGPGRSGKSKGGGGTRYRDATKHPAWVS
jgi:hypothetical protein